MLAVVVDSLSGDALDWFKAALLLQLAFSTVVVVVLVAIAVRLFWGRA
jgi:hypothetical protein